MSDSDRNEQIKQAIITSLKLLASTPKSRTELAERLSRKGYPESVIQEALSDLEKKRLLNDAGFAENLKTRFIFGKPSGSKKILFEMKRHGIPMDIRERVMETLDPEEEKVRARELAVSKWEKSIRLEPDKRKKKIYDFLIRRGFDFSLARNIVEELERSPHEGG